MKKKQKIIEHSKSIHLYMFADYEKEIDDKIKNCFINLIKKNEDNLKKKFMKIYLEIDRQLFSFGYLIAEPNLDFSKEDVYKKINGYIYIKEWNGKNELSFWTKDDSKINMKEIIGKFLNEYFQKEKDDKKLPLVFGSRYLATEEKKLVESNGFKNVFSFHDFVEDFKRKVKTHYFYSNKNRIVLKKINNENVKEFEKTKFFNYFDKWENFDNKMQKINSLGDKSIEIKDGDNKECYISTKPGQLEVEVEFKSFNIVLTTGLMMKIYENFISNEEKFEDIKKVIVIFHVTSNILQLSYFNKESKHKYSKSYKNFENELWDDYFNKEFIDDILNNKRTIFYGGRKSGMTSYINNNLKEALEVKYSNDKYSLLHFEHKEFVSPGETLDDIKIFLENVIEKLNEINTKKKRKWHPFFNGSDNTKLVFSASIPIFFSSFIGAITSINWDNETSKVVNFVFVGISLFLTGAAILYLISAKCIFPKSLDDKAKKNKEVHKKINFDDRKSILVIDGIDSLNINDFLKLVPFLKFEEDSTVNFSFVISDDEPERIVKEIQKVISNTWRNNETKILPSLLKHQNIQKQYFILNNFFEEIYSKRREHIVKFYKNKGWIKKWEEEHYSQNYKQKYNYTGYISSEDKPIIDDCFSVLSFFAFYAKSYNQIKHLLNQIKNSIESLNLSDTKNNSINEEENPILKIVIKNCISILYNDYYKEVYIRDLKDDSLLLSEKNERLKNSYCVRALENKEKWTKEIQSKFLKS